MSERSYQQEVLDRYESSLLGVFGKPTRALVRGSGSRVWDADGREYLDLLGGIAVNSLGHAHPRLAEAIAKQAGQLLHVSNFFTTEQQVCLAESLLTRAAAPAGSGVFFTNSGTEANEAALKIARRTGRTRLLALSDSFHGRTLGALSLTAKEAYRGPFAPLLKSVDFVPAGDVAALARELAANDVAALFVEPIQGEAGVQELSADYLRAARELTAQAGTLLVVDEVQTGIGRTGDWFAHSAAGIVPDVMTLAKGLGGGFPIGAVIAYGEANASLLTAGQHGTTFGGNPLAATAGLTVLSVIADEHLLENARLRGQQFRRALATLPGVREVRGRGLLLGIGLEADSAADIVAAGLARPELGLILNAPRPDTIRLAPALTISEAETSLACEALAELITDARKEA
ncbi:acetylornithine transaminase [Dermabacteraceae bacterium P13095]